MARRIVTTFLCSILSIAAWVLSSHGAVAGPDTILTNHAAIGNNTGSIVLADSATLPTQFTQWTTPDAYAPQGVNIGDGITDATSYIQAAFDSRLPVRCVAGSTYLVSKAGMSRNIDGVSIPYALKMPSGLYFDGTGCTIKAAIAANVANVPTIFVPDGSDTVATANITLVNVAVDHQGPSQPVGAHNWREAIYTTNTPNLQIYGFRVDNGFGFCGRFIEATGPRISDLRCNSSLGQGWAFGSGSTNRLLYEARIRNVYTTDVLGSAWNAILPGNPGTFYLQNSTADNFLSNNDAAGFKVEGLSKRNTFSNFHFRGGPNGTSNSGFKIQKDSTGAPSDNTIIGLTVENAFGTGIYETGSTNSTVIGYTGIGNATGAHYPDVWVEGANFQLRDWSIKGYVGTGSQGGIIYLRPNSVTPHIGLGKFITPACNNCCGILDESTTNGVVVEGATISDSSDALTYYFRQTGTGSASWGNWTGPAPTVTNRNRINLKPGDYSSNAGVITQGSGPINGSVTLAKGATKTFVASTSVYSVNETMPIINIQPVNSSAQALGAFRYTILDDTGDPNKLGFILITSAAAGTETFTWNVVGWYNVEGSRSGR